MPNRFYKVVLGGTTRNGFDRTVVLKNLAKIFNKSPELIEKLLSGNPRVIKKGLDLAAAEKYQEILTKAGAQSHFELETEQSPEITEPRPSSQYEPESASSHELICPRCGYIPKSDEDVLAIRGDCPRCGLLVRKDPQIYSFTSDEIESAQTTDAANIYGERIPASWKRRNLASMHSLTILLIAYLLFFFIFIFFIVPPDLIFRTLLRDFLQTVFAAFPMAIMSLTVFVVSFVLPLVTGGRSWGQQMTNITVLYAGEERMGGLQLALALRAAAILMISFVPGLIAVRVGDWLKLLAAPGGANRVMIVTGMIAWIFCWIYEFSRKDRRGLLDLVGDTIQVEEEPLPPGAVQKAMLPLLGIVALWLVFSFALPYLLK
ncbi:MAG: RDD family protein [Desulfomonilaceae bacterium]